MNVELIRYTPNPDWLCGFAAAECYQGQNAERSLGRALEGKHHSTIEHSNFTFRISGVSRVLLAQLTRHRIASFSVQSQRYCGVVPEFVTPQSVKDAGYADQYQVLCNAAYELMCEMMQSGVPAEDARYIIPQGVECSMVMTMNARELWHLFELRCCRRAQWEIRDLAWEMLGLCKSVAPKIFEFAGPSCLYGRCGEGGMSCGKPYGGKA